MPQHRTITVAELPDLLGQPGTHPFLYCPSCGSEYSAHRGDYWAARPDAPLTCSNGHRRRGMRLVRRLARLVEVKR